MFTEEELRSARKRIDLVMEQRMQEQPPMPASLSVFGSMREGLLASFTKIRFYSVSNLRYQANSDCNIKLAPSLE